MVYILYIHIIYKIYMINRVYIISNRIYILTINVSVFYMMMMHIPFSSLKYSKISVDV